MKALKGILNLSSLPTDVLQLPDELEFQELSLNLITPVSLSIVKWKGTSKPFLPYFPKEHNTLWKDVKLQFNSFQDFSGEGLSIYKEKDLKIGIKDGSIIPNERELPSERKEVPSTPNFKNIMSGRSRSNKMQSTKMQSTKSFKEPVQYDYSVKFTKYYTEMDYKGVESTHDGELTLNRKIQTMEIAGVFKVCKNDKCLYGGHFSIDADIPSISEIFRALTWEAVLVVKKKRIAMTVTSNVKLEKRSNKKLEMFTKYKPPESKDEEPNDIDPMMTLVNVSLKADLAEDFQIDFSGAVGDDPAKAKDSKISWSASKTSRLVDKFVKEFVNVNVSELNVFWSRRRWDFSDVLIQLSRLDRHSKYRIELIGKYYADST